MKRLFFKLLARINKAVLPSLSDKDPTKLSKKEKLLAGYRYWVTKNAL